MSVSKSAPKTVERNPAKILLGELRKAGVRLSVDSGGMLSARVDSASRMTPATRKYIADHEAELRAVLEKETNWPGRPKC